MFALPRVAVLIYFLLDFDSELVQVIWHHDSVVVAVSTLKSVLWSKIN